jgi:hypothetical protein
MLLWILIRRRDTRPIVWPMLLMILLPTHEVPGPILAPSLRHLLPSRLVYPLSPEAPTPFKRPLLQTTQPQTHGLLGIWASIFLHYLLLLILQCLLQSQILLTVGHDVDRAESRHFSTLSDQVQRPIVWPMLHTTAPQTQTIWRPIVRPLQQLLLHLVRLMPRSLVSQAGPLTMGCALIVDAT